MSEAYQYGKDVPLEIERLNDDNVNLIAKFSCGNENIDDCIRADSISNKTVSYLYINSETQEIVAYCSISCAGVVHEVIEDGSTDPVPKTLSAIEIDFFAVNAQYRGLPFKETSSRYDTLSAFIFRCALTI